MIESRDEKAFCGRLVLHYYPAGIPRVPAAIDIKKVVSFLVPPATDVLRKTGPNCLEVIALSTTNADGFSPFI
jgi:hypothetical protein